jgi:mannose-6-phosphate isomerase
LIKFIDASDDLSVQVHPDDEAAQSIHNENGKTEIWYIIDAEEDAELILGVSTELNKEDYKKAVADGQLKQFLNSVPVKKGDVAYIPAGRIHAIRKGVFLAEIQQSSDLTYRIYDWDRKDLNGKYRQLHTELASEVVDLKKRNDYLTEYKLSPNQYTSLVSNRFFTVNITEISVPLKRDYSNIDSFIILMTIEGDYRLESDKGSIDVFKGECILIPATVDHTEIIPDSKVRLLEVYI